MPHIIFLNGPPRAGKDTIAAELVRRFDAIEYKMSKPLKQFVQQFFGLTHEEYKRIIEADKDKPQKLLFGKTAREIQISLSEAWAKPVLGQHVFGELAARNIMAQPTQIVAISDSGFVDECLPIIRTFGARNCMLVRIRRANTSFDGDSRSYFELPIFTQELNNQWDKHKDREMFDANIDRLIDRWYNGPHRPVIVAP